MIRAINSARKGRLSYILREQYRIRLLLDTQTGNRNFKDQLPKLIRPSNKL